MTKLNLFLPALISAFFFWPFYAQADGKWTTSKSVPLRQGPSESSKLSINLQANTVVIRSSERRGPWIRVTTEDKKHSGWIHLFDLQMSRTSAASATMTSALRTFTQAQKASMQPTTATAPLGIRGLDADDIVQAKPDPLAVQRAETLQVSEASAKQFANRQQLKSRKIEELPVPELPKPSRTPTSESRP